MGGAKKKKDMNKYYKKVTVLTDLSEGGCIVYCSEILQGQPHKTGGHLLRMVWIFHKEAPRGATSLENGSLRGSGLVFVIFMS